MNNSGPYAYQGKNPFQVIAETRLNISTYFYEWQIMQICHFYVFLRGERMFFGQCKDESLAVQAFRIHASFSNRQNYKSRVNQTSYQCFYVFRGVSADEPDVQRGMRVRQILADFRDYAKVDERRIAQIPSSGMQSVGGARFLNSAIRMDERKPGLGCEGVAGSGERYLLPTSRPLKQFDVNFPLQIADLGAECGLRNMQPKCGLRKVQFLGEYGDIPVQAKLDPRVHRAFRTTITICSWGAFLRGYEKAKTQSLSQRIVPQAK